MSAIKHVRYREVPLYSVSLGPMFPFLQAVLPLPGDGEKELWSDSDYKGKFKEHLLNKRQRVVNQTFARTDTIRGDARSHDGTKMFGTTANRAFPERKPGRREKVPDRVKVGRDLYVLLFLVVYIRTES